MADVVHFRGIYRPANGTEGEYFYEDWCARCNKDDPYSDVFCPIFTATLAHDIDDPEYPKEWCYDSEGSPQCTAFSDQPVSDAYRCEHTIDMFEENTKHEE